MTQRERDVAMVRDALGPTDFDARAALERLLAALKRAEEERDDLLNRAIEAEEMREVGG